MNRILVTGMMFVLVASTLDAAPRGRRAARRRARQATSQPAVRNYSSSNYYRTPSTTTTPQQPSLAATRYTTPTYSASPSTPQNFINQSPVPTAPSPAPAVYNPVPPTPVPISVSEVAQPVTAYKPIVTEAAAAEPVVVAMADTLPTIDGASFTASSTATAIPTVQSGNSQVLTAAAIAPIPDPIPSLKNGGALTQAEPFCASCTVIPAGKSFNSALAELNSIRASKGIPALIEDQSLSALAHQKASIQANRGAMYHPGGSMGGARFEGVGMGPRFTSCYQDARNVTYAGAATVVGRNGQRYHCLLVR